ncbi:hypothetical protein C8R43DRAFT_1108260 [Mycena crocata]|nr:hypothetical protein C8R43DRAFT_1108260 [Mycena crocata]
MYLGGSDMSQEASVDRGDHPPDVKEASIAVGGRSTRNTQRWLNFLRAGFHQRCEDQIEHKFESATGEKSESESAAGLKVCQKPQSVRCQGEAPRVPAGGANTQAAGFAATWENQPATANGTDEVVNRDRYRHTSFNHDDASRKYDEESQPKQRKEEEGRGLSGWERGETLPRVGRVRSNSASSRALYTASSNINVSSFFDAPPPPPNTRNGPILTTHRLPIEGKGEVEAPHTGQNNATHAPLALAAPHAPASPPHPAPLALLFPYPPGPLPMAAPAPHAPGTRASRRRGPRYTLDVGAYGIPKRGHRGVRGLVGATQQGQERTDAPLAVQVGEDAYFVRDNAMGVADGVGGWARVKHPAPALPPSSPSASALFARRLMHFCADEVERASHSHPHPHQHPHPHSSSSSHPFSNSLAQPTLSTSNLSRQQPVVTPWPSSSAFASSSSSSFPSPFSTSSPQPSTRSSAGTRPGAAAGRPSAWDPYATSAHPASPPPFAAYNNVLGEHAFYASSAAAGGFADASSYAPYNGYTDEYGYRDEFYPDPYAAAEEYANGYAEDGYAPEDLDAAALLDAELAELADGLDVLGILERAYERTLGAHVVSVPGSDAACSFSSSASLASAKGKDTQPQTIPLLAGSSTALVAVLDYVPAGEVAGGEVGKYFSRLHSVWFIVVEMPLNIPS